MKTSDPRGVGQIKLTRRSAIVGLASSVALCTLPRFAWANDLQSDYSLPSSINHFYRLSSVLTERNDLNPQISKRTLSALIEIDPSMKSNAEKLFALVADNMSAKDLFAAAEAHGLKQPLLDIQYAWYTGTAGSGENSRLIAYKEALMYRTVEDGLVVPTYCDFGPLWWVGTPVPPSQLPNSINAS